MTTALSLLAIGSSTRLALATVDGGDEGHGDAIAQLRRSARLPITWIRPMTAPMMPMVGAYPPMLSNTLAA